MLELKNRDFIFLSRNGNFFIIPINKYSRFFGFFIPYKDFYIKILDHIENLNLNKEEIKKIILEKSYKTKIIYEKDFEIYSIFNNGLIYECSNISKIKLFFDIKHIYDIDEWGRMYSYEISYPYVKIRFQKNDINITLYIQGFVDIKENNEKWINFFYDFDKERKSPPFNRYIYCPFTLTCKKIIISLNKKSYLKEDKVKYTILDLIKDRIKSFVHNWISTGYPWYYQEWTRDILISLKGLYYIFGKKIIKEKIYEYSEYLLPNGKMKNISNDSNGNSDSFGWFSKRVFDFKDLFIKEEFLKLVNIIEKNLITFTETHYDPKTKLFIAFPNESWMDTLNRKYPIELQFLILNIYENLYKIKRDERYRELYFDLKENIVKKYVRDVSLIDSYDNNRIRPNIFLCYYIKKDFFEKEKWQSFIDYSLNHLWLSWGGISSLSIFDADFKKIHNGDSFFVDKDKSMHNGDSWIYLNHIAAIVMNDLNREKYKDKIKKIFLSSLKYLKEIGTLPELSSAKKRDISGAISQLWSLSTFIELIKELKIEWNKIEKILKNI